MVSVPVIASGGAGEAAHFPPAVAAGADAVLAASVFHFGTVAISDVRELSLPTRGYPGALVACAATRAAALRPDM